MSLGSTADEPAPDPGADRGGDPRTGSAQDVAHDALHLIAEGIAGLVGFEVAAVSVVTAPGQLTVLAVAGNPEAREALIGTPLPVELMLAELEAAEDWGQFKFVAQQRRSADSEQWCWTPDVAATDDPDAWQPLDLLVAPLRDRDGVLHGLLSIDCPLDGRRPDEARRVVLNRYAAQASRALMLSARQRRRAEQLAEQVRLLSAARDIVRNVSSQARSGVEVDAMRAGLLDCFSARGMWVHVFDEDAALGTGLGLTYTFQGVARQPSALLVETIDALAVESWATQQVGLLSRRPHDTSHLPRVLAHEEERMLSFMAEVGIGTVLLAPLGSGTECLGSLVLTRGIGAPAWSTMEIETAREIGRDLGRTVLDARVVERERKAVLELRALDDYKNSLITTLSHELKSPLAVMLGNLEVLAERQEVGLTGDDVDALLSAVGRGADRLVRIVDNLLVLSRVEDARGPRVTVPVDLADVVEEVRALIPLVSQPRLVVHTDAESPVLAIGDPAELETLIGNLVGNALKYSAPDSPVTVTLSHPSPDQVEVSCADVGIGIDETDLPRLFDEFFRSDDSEVRRRPGTGLGLAIADRIVTRHGGRIDVRSTPGVGTDIRVLLPASAG